MRSAARPLQGLRVAFSTTLVVALVAASPHLARAADFVDPTCPGATEPTRAFVAVTHHLPQSLENLLDASRAVALEYDVCAANFRSLAALENMNYALVQQARSNLWSANLESKYGRREAARHDIAQVLAETAVVLGFRDRATNPGPDNNAAGGGPVMDLRHDSVPSRFDAQARDLAAQAKALLGALDAPASPPPKSPAPAVSP